MFEAFYGFARPPFSKTIDTDNLFAASGQKELLVDSVLSCGPPHLPGA